MNNNYYEREITLSSSNAQYLKHRHDTLYAGDSRHFLLSKIEQYSKGLTINSSVYKEILRSLLSRINPSYINAQEQNVQVKVHHGRQDRTVAKKFQENNLILPYATIYQSAVMSDDQKRRVGSTLVHSSYWDDSSQRATRVVTTPDVPIKAEYTLSIWAKYLSDLDQISSKIRSEFNPNIILRTPFSEIIPAYIKEETDVSTTDVADKEDRLIRKNFIFEIQTYIQSPKFQVTSTGKIIHLNTEIWL